MLQRGGEPKIHHAAFELGLAPMRAARPAAISKGFGRLRFHFCDGSAPFTRHGGAQHLPPKVRAMALARVLIGE